MTTLRLLVVVVLGCLSLSPVALGAEGGSGGAGGANSSNLRPYMPPLAQESAYDRAVAEVKAGRYANAIPILREVVAKDPRSADGFNMLGYSLRKLGQREQAMPYYQEALRLDPKHLGALEYQGELFIQLGDVARAEANLEQLARLCGRCEQHDDLAKAVAAHKAKPRS